VYSQCMTCDEIEKMIKEKLVLAPSLNAIFKFDFGDDGLIVVDGKQNPAVVSREDAQADTTVLCSTAILQKILDGSQDPTMAFMTGKIKIQGSMGNAMKLSAFLED